MLKSFILMWHCSDALLEGIDFCVRRFSESVIWSYTVSSALRFTDQIKTKKLWETFGYQYSKRGAAAPSANMCSSLLCVCSLSFEMLWCGVIYESLRLVSSNQIFSVVVFWWRTHLLQVALVYFFVVSWRYIYLTIESVILGHLNISIWFPNIKSYLSCVWWFYLIFFFFFNCSFECSCLSGWIYLLSFFFGFSVVASHWSKVEGFRCAVTQDCSWHVFAVLLTETETWQLACVSLWEHTWICFMTVWTRRHKTYFSIAKKFVLIHFLYCILWQLCRDKFMKVQEGPRAGKVPLFFCARMKVVGVINMWGVFCAVGSVLRHFL